MRDKSLTHDLEQCHVAMLSASPTLKWSIVCKHISHTRYQSAYSRISQWGSWGILGSYCSLNSQQASSACKSLVCLHRNLIVRHHQRVIATLGVTGMILQTCNKLGIWKNVWPTWDQDVRPTERQSFTRCHVVHFLPQYIIFVLINVLFIL